MNLKHLIIAAIVGMGTWGIPILVVFGTHSLIDGALVFLAEFAVLALVGLRIRDAGTKSRWRGIRQNAADTNKESNFRVD